MPAGLLQVEVVTHVLPLADAGWARAVWSYHTGRAIG
jgi:hypothetical protein